MMMEFLPDELEHLQRLHVFSTDNKKKRIYYESRGFENKTEIIFQNI